MRAGPRLCRAGRAGPGRGGPGRVGPGRGGAPIGLLGGSFNPAHGGHRRISLFARRALGLAEVWWLVSPGNPLKPAAGMAPIETRMRRALSLARQAPIKVSAIESELGTRYTADTLRALRRRFPRRRFVWLMGADNLAQLHLWRDWRRLAREMPIAVIARPGYETAARTSRARAWLRRFRLSATCLASRPCWSAPALIELRFDPDPRSASAIRRATPYWAQHSGGAGLGGRCHSPPAAIRDQVTRRLLASARPSGCKQGHQM